MGLKEQNSTQELEVEIIGNEEYFEKEEEEEEVGEEEED